MTDHLVRILSEDGALRAVAATTGDLTRAICQRQGTDPTGSVALGRLVTGTALMGALLKGKQRLALTMEGNGPLQRLHAETDADGQVCAAVKNPLTGLPPKAGRFDVAGAIGKAGFLHVTKDLGLKEPYRSMVQLYTSEVAEDLAYYLTTSEQVPSTVGLGVDLDKNLVVASAGGFMVQAMPGCDDSLLSQIEARLQQLPSISQLMRDGYSPRQLLAQIFDTIPFTVQAEMPLTFRCHCSRAQVAAMLGGLDAAELRALLDTGEAATITCEFCKENYTFSPDELGELLRQRN